MSMHHAKPLGLPAVRSAFYFAVSCLLLAAVPVSAEPVSAEQEQMDQIEAAQPAVSATAAAVESAAAVEPAAAESAAEQVIASELVADKRPAGPVDDSLEGVKKSLLKLKRDLVILEEDLLFPASSQVAVYLSMDLGEFFALDAVTLKLNGKEVHHHLYTEKQVDALFRGAVQKLYVGNAKQGNNRVTAFFTGRGPSGRDFKRATTVEFDKSFEPTYIELAVSDSEAKYQPDFTASVSE